MTKPTIFVDLDHTLAQTIFLPLLQFKSPPNRSRFRYGLQNVAVMMRPDAKEFLQDLSTDFRLICLTRGYSVFQTKVLMELDLLSSFESVIGHDSANSATFTNLETFVVVDDSEPDAESLKHKFRYLGFAAALADESSYCRLLDQHYVQVDRFHGNNDVLPLTSACPIVRQKILDQQL